MDDRVLDLCELSNDLLFHKIPKERLAYYADASLEAGRTAARGFLGQDVRKLYRQSGSEIRYAGNGKQNYGVILRGQSVMGEEQCSVDVYQDSIRELAAHSAWEGQSLTLEQALDASSATAGSIGSTALSRMNWTPLSAYPFWDSSAGLISTAAARSPPTPLPGSCWICRSSPISMTTGI